MTANDGTDATIAICSFVHAAGTIFIAANQGTRNQNAGLTSNPLIKHAAITQTIATTGNASSPFAWRRS